MSFGFRRAQDEEFEQLIDQWQAREDELTKESHHLQKQIKNYQASNTVRSLYLDFSGRKIHGNMTLCGTKVHTVLT